MRCCCDRSRDERQPSLVEAAAAVEGAEEVETRDLMRWHQAYRQRLCYPKMKLSSESGSARVVHSVQAMFLVLRRSPGQSSCQRMRATLRAHAF